MHLYLISRKGPTGYDQYDSAVVCAPDADTARAMDPGTGRAFRPDEKVPSAWCHPNAVDVIHLGPAAPDVLAGVVCASFNAG